MFIDELQMKPRRYPEGYHRLTNIQQTLYRVCADEFDRLCNEIDEAKQVLPIRQRTLNKSHIAREAAQLLGHKKLQHSHMSQSNCLFLFDAINAWNQALTARFEGSHAYLTSQAKQPTKADLKKQIEELEDSQVEFCRKAFDAMVESSLLESKSEQVLEIQRLKSENYELTKLTVHQKDTIETLFKELAAFSDPKQSQTANQLNKALIKLRTALVEQGINPDELVSKGTLK